MAAELHAHECRAPQLLGAHQPAGQFRRQRRFALAPLAPQHRPALLAQQPLQRQQIAAAAHKARIHRLRRHLSQPGPQAGAQVLLGLGRGGGRKQLGVVLLLIQHRHKPVGQLQLADAVALAPAGVAVQRALAGEHRLAHPLAPGQLGVEGGHKPPRRFHQHAVAHRHHRGHTPLQQFAGHRFGSRFCLGALAGLQQHQRDAVVVQQRPQLVGVQRLVAAPGELVAVAGILKAEAPQAHAAVVDAVAVEMHHVIGLSGLLGSGQLGLQGGVGGGVQQAEMQHLPQLLGGGHQGQGTGAVVEVTAGVVLRAGADQQHPDRWRHHRHRAGPFVRQPAPHAGGPAALKQKALAVVQQLPGQGEQGGGGLLGKVLLRLTGAVQQGIVDANGEATARPRLHPRPGLQHVRRGL